MEHRTNPSQRRLGTSQLHQNVIYGSVLFLLGLASGFVQVYHSDIIHLVNFFFLNHFHLFQCKTIHTHNTLLQIQKKHQVATEDPTNQPNTNAPDVFDVFVSLIGGRSLSWWRGVSTQPFWRSSLSTKWTASKYLSRGGSIRSREYWVGWVSIKSWFCMGFLLGVELLMNEFEV